MQFTREIENAVSLFLTGDIVNACVMLNQVLEIDPNNQQARSELNKFMGIARSLEHQNDKTQKFKIIPEQLRKRLWQMFLDEKFSELFELLENLIPICEDDYEFFYLSAVSSRKLKRYDEGMSFIKKALLIEPANYAGNLEAGKLFKDAKIYDLAMKTYEYCISLNPSRDDAYLAMAEVLMKVGRHQDAITTLETIKDNEESHFKAMEKIAECYFGLADYVKASEIYENLLEKREDGSEIWKNLIHSNLINTYMELDQVSKSLKSIENVKSLVHSNLDDQKLIANPRYNLSHAYLKLGNCNEGWREYLHRFDRKDFPSPCRKFNVPRAKTIEEMAGRRVLIWREQGIGDELMLYNLIPALIEKTRANIIIECETRLVMPVTRSFPDALVREENFDRETLFSYCEDYDLHLPLADLMILFNLNMRKKNLLRPWFKPDDEKLRFWRSALPNDNLNIAFAMRGHLQEPRRKVNYIGAHLFNSLIEGSDYNWICVDYTIHDPFLEQLSPETLKKVSIPNINLKDDFDAMGALMSCCDLLISPITAIRSLASSVGTRNISFVSGSRSPYNLGMDAKVFVEYEPFMFPKGVSMRLPHEITPIIKDEYLLKFFNAQIQKSIVSDDLLLLKSEPLEILT